VKEILFNKFYFSCAYIQ